MKAAKKIYKEEFRQSYRKKDYTRAFELLDKNPEIKKYLAFDEKIVMGAYKIGKELEEMLYKANFPSELIKFEWEHRN